MRYIASADARRDLEAIWRYTATRWNESQADLYIDALIVRFAWLTRNKGLWRSRSEIADGLFSYPEQSHMILFRASEGNLQIVRVLHERMDVKRHI